MFLQSFEDAARHVWLQAGSPRGCPYRRILPDLIAQSTTLYCGNYAVFGTGTVAPLRRRYPDVVLQGRATECLLVYGDLRMARRWIRRIHGKQEDVDAEYH